MRLLSPFLEAMRLCAALTAFAFLALPVWIDGWSGVAVSLQFILIGGLIYGALNVTVYAAKRFNQSREEGEH